MQPGDWKKDLELRTKKKLELVSVKVDTIENEYLNIGKRYHTMPVDWRRETCLESEIPDGQTQPEYTKIYKAFEAIEHPGLPAEVLHLEAMQRARAVAKLLVRNYRFTEAIPILHKLWFFDTERLGAHMTDLQLKVDELWQDYAVDEEIDMEDEDWAGELTDELEPQLQDAIAGRSYMHDAHVAMRTWAVQVPCVKGWLENGIARNNMEALKLAMECEEGGSEGHRFDHELARELFAHEGDAALIPY